MKNKAIFPILLVALIAVGCSTEKPRSQQSRLQQFIAATLNDAKNNYEMGNFEPARADLFAVLKADPKNQEAGYYLNLVHQAEMKLWTRTNGVHGVYQTIPPQPVY